MAKEPRAGKRGLRRRALPNANERLAAAEARLDEVSRNQDRLREELERARADVQQVHDAHAAGLAEQLESIRAQAKDDYRRQVGVIDVVRRQQRHQDETFSARVDALETSVTGRADAVEVTVAEFTTDQTTRLAQIEARADHLETTARMVIGRIDAFEAFRVELGTIVERINSTIRAIREAVEKLATRTDVLEAETSQQFAASAALGERVAAGLRGQEVLAEHLQRAHGALNNLDERLNGLSGTLDERLNAISGTLTQFSPLPEQVSALAESVTTMNDRVVAVELLANQHNNLDLQLERAEEFERVLAEVDPAAYASREDLDALRRVVEGIVPQEHSE